MGRTNFVENIDEGNKLEDHYERNKHIKHPSSMLSESKIR